MPTLATPPNAATPEARPAEPQALGADAALSGGALTQGKVSPAELAELIGAFNEVTDRLHSTHQQLHAEVARLTGELRHANEQLERSRRLAALGEMAAGIAHEVRNPLASIRLYSRMLLEDLADRPVEHVTVSKIDAATVGLAAIVEDLLTFAREFKVRRDSTPVRELLEASVEACREDRIPGVDAVTFAVESQFVRGEDGPCIEVDRGLVVRALVNVVRNAVQAMTEAGVQDRRIGLSAAVDDGVCTMVIQDTGPGVPEHVASRMFNPFFTTRETGTGLGLAIVHRIVEAHGGQVSVRNAPGGGGARVQIRLPVSSGSLLPGAAAAPGVLPSRAISPGQDARGTAEIQA